MIDPSNITINESKPELFAGPGRPKSNVGEQWSPVVARSWHLRGEDGKGTPLSFDASYGDVEELTKDLRAAGRMLGCSILVRWVPKDEKRHQAIVVARGAEVTDSDPWTKLGTKLDASPGVLHFRAVPQITRPRATPPS